jgi:hypothetical protein
MIMEHGLRFLMPALFGLIGWFIAAMFIRVAIPLGWFAPPLTAVMFIAAVPASWLLVELVRRLAGGADLLARVTIMCVVALLLDGLALVWLPGLYGASGAELLAPAAWLLFGVGVIELVALAFESRRT